MKTNIKEIQKAKVEKDVLTWLTCYDYSFASAINSTSLDMILVGDSGGMVLLGYLDTVPVTMNEMLAMCSAVRRGAPDKFIVGDMPKGSYESSNSLAIENAMRFVKESGVDAIKLEGGIRMAERTKAIVDAGISVIGHIGLTPQSSTSLGGYRVTGREKLERESLLNDAQALESSGAFAILLEAMPAGIAGHIAKTSSIPIFGIGAGADVDGQLLILHDLLGLYPDLRPKFAKNYIPVVMNDFMNQLKGQSDLVAFGRKTRQDGLFELCKLAVQAYVDETKARQFPSEIYTYSDQKV